MRSSGGGDRAQHRDPGAERGIPDGLLVSVLAFLLGLTLLVWTATGLAALAEHGGWPEGVTLTRTPQALRHLMTQPRDLPSAWPGTPPEALSGYGLFWGILVGELLVAVVLMTFVIGTLARWRAVRARRTTGAAGTAPTEAAEASSAAEATPIAVTEAAPAEAAPPVNTAPAVEAAAATVPEPRAAASPVPPVPAPE
ncbi:type VI secretion protein, partial [Streptomyces sp. UNOB3_S3]|nr:type VI secretion protein [Streptomyces sp. UNOB3_S3]